MKYAYNELVGVQATFSKVTRRYSLIHHYRWKKQNVVGKHGTMRTFEMQRYQPIKLLCRNLRDVYAPVVRAVWRQETDAHFSEYLQFPDGLIPGMAHLDGHWELWAEWE